MDNYLDFVAFFSKLPGNIYLADREGVFIYCNDAQARFLILRREKI